MMSIEVRETNYCVSKASIDLACSTPGQEVGEYVSMHVHLDISGEPQSMAGRRGESLGAAHRSNVVN